MDKSDDGIDDCGIKHNYENQQLLHHVESGDDNLIAKNIISGLTTDIVQDIFGGEPCARSSDELEYIFVYPKELDENYKSVTSESCEPITSHLEQADAKPEEIVEEELEYIFRHTFDFAAHHKLESPLDFNIKTETQLNDVCCGNSFQDIELCEIWHNHKFSVDDEPKKVSSSEFYDTQNQRQWFFDSLNSPVKTSKTVVVQTPLDEFSIMDKLDVSGVIEVGSEQVTNLGPQLLHVIQNKKNWDIMIYIENYQFRCLLFALQMYSPYFRRFKSSNTLAIRLPSKWVTPLAFKVIYNWILHEPSMKQKSYNNRSIIEIYSAAQFLGINELVDSVCQTFDAITNEEKIFSLLPEVFRLDMPAFEQLFISRISRFFLTLVASQEFVDMKPRHVIQLLASENIGVNCEIEVIYAAVRWLNHEWPQRRAQLIDVMRCVRFSLLPPMFLRFLQSPQKTRVLNEISKCPMVQEEINKAFVYTSSSLLYKGPHAVLKFQLPDFEVPEHRKWLLDRQCSYHRNLICDMRQFFTYAQFLQYLQTLQSNERNYWETLEYLDEGMPSCPC